MYITFLRFLQVFLETCLCAVKQDMLSVGLRWAEKMTQINLHVICLIRKLHRHLLDNDRLGEKVRNDSDLFFSASESGVLEKSVESFLKGEKPSKYKVSFKPRQCNEKVSSFVHLYILYSVLK